jgi:uncharacterized protein YjbI with pentapeptide repeats
MSGVPEPKPDEWRISPEQHARFHWGVPISEERQAYLRGLADKQRDWAAQPEATRGESVFKGVQLTGADVTWLAGYALTGQDDDADDVAANQGDLLEPDAYLDLSALQLQGADLVRVQLQGALLVRVQLQGTELLQAQLQGARLHSAQLQGASLAGAQLQGAELIEAQLRDANLSEAQLRDANLSGAQLQGARLDRAQLQRTDLTAARMNVETHLTDVAVDTQTRVADVVWDNVPLTRVSWPLQLGDETMARKAKEVGGKTQDSARRTREFAAAVRANRVLAVTLRAQGLNEDADRYAYRAQILQRQVLRRQGHPFRALFSWFLDVLAGHGYKPGRTLIAYLLAILSFGTAYYFIGQAVGPHLSPLGAFVFSMTSFHGRGFFPGGIALDDPITVLAALEAFTGLVIEVSFIATFTQRFFAR